MSKIKPQFNVQRSDLANSVPLVAPYVVYVEPSSYCNLECKFCPQHISPSEIKKENMSLDTFHKIINDTLAFSTKPKLLRFCGLGDPLFNKNFVQMLEYAHEKNAFERLELITNGLLINPKNVKEIAKFLDRVIISLEGLSNDDYEEFTCKKIDFEKFCQSLKELYSVEGRRATVHIKIHNSAASSAEKIAYFKEKFGNIADEIYVENLVNLWPEIESNLGIEAGHRFDGGNLNKVKVCPQIFKSVQVNSDGRVIPCCIDWKGINIVGNINDSRLEEIWHGKPLHNLRMRHLNGERHSFSPCMGCTMNEYSDKDNLDVSIDLIKQKLCDA